MKLVRYMLFSLTVLFVATAAQAQQTRVQANIPFKFVVGDRVYSAGEYKLKSLSDTNSSPINVANKETAESGVVLSNACSSSKPSATTKLVFRRIDDQFFLYQVWIQGSGIGRQFPISHTDVKIAQDQEKPEFVIVAANISH